MKWSLEEEIEYIRAKMMDTADKEGLTADQTMELSRELDRLLNQFQTEQQKCIGSEGKTWT
ncbi:aspartyl-phosphate phosphatase Spo0E family protein [Sporosarcina sp. FSL K6-1522]|uniref:aspartyl-phosphate phosphatase Spo0E family protein n=1 Tax=Sporosarcina sp. FSL K6-1522 TaxID=2921554 RepID=UPI00315A7A71